MTLWVIVSLLLGITGFYVFLSIYLLWRLAASYLAKSRRRRLP